MKNIDPCEAIRKAYDELQTKFDGLQGQVNHCHALLDTAGVQANPDLQVRVRSVLTAGTLGSLSLDNTLQTLRDLLNKLEQFKNG